MKLRIIDDTIKKLDKWQDTIDIDLLPFKIHSIMNRNLTTLDRVCLIKSIK